MQPELEGRTYDMIERGCFIGAATKAGAGFALAAALTVGPIIGAAAAEELHVLNWQGYGTDETWALELFEERTGVEVVHDYFNSEQEILTKLRNSPGPHEVVLIHHTFTEQAAKGRLNHSRPDERREGKV